MGSKRWADCYQKRRFQCLNRLCIFCGERSGPCHPRQRVDRFSALTGFVSSVGLRLPLWLLTQTPTRFSALTGFVSSVGLAYCIGSHGRTGTRFSALTGFVSSVGHDMGYPDSDWRVYVSVP